MRSWDILVPTFHARTPLFVELLDQLEAQMEPGVGVIAARDDRTEPLGDKCQRLMEASDADYTCLCADDALLHPEYIKQIHTAMQADPDVIGFQLRLWGSDGPAQVAQAHSIAFQRVPELAEGHYGPFHCVLGTWMPVKRSIGSRVRFHGEIDDEPWTRGVLATGLLKREFYIDEVLVMPQVLDQGFHGEWESVEPTPDPQRSFVRYV